MKILESQFSVTSLSRGYYRVVYTSPKGRKYEALMLSCYVDDLLYIDSPTQKELQRLRSLIISYHKTYN